MADDVLVDSVEALETLVQDCRPQEQYTFIMEAMCGPLPELVKTKAIEKLRDAIVGIKAEKRYMYLSSCLPIVLKRFATCEGPFDASKQDDFIERLGALQALALAFPAAGDAAAEDAWDDEEESEERRRRKMQTKVLRSMVSAFLLKLLQRALPVLWPIAGLEVWKAPEEEDASQSAAKGASKGAKSDKPARLRLVGPDVRPECVRQLCSLAKDAASTSTRPLSAILEEIDLGEPTGDGGGDLEISPLSLASFVLLSELSELGAHSLLQPYVVPLCFSPARRINILMRSCYVLLCNEDATPGVLNLADLGSLEDAEAASAASAASGRSGPSHPARGLALFAQAAAPLFEVIAAQSPKALASLTSSSCRWHPERTFQKLLESLTQCPNIEQEARGAIFRVQSSVLRAFPWPARFDLYHAVIKNSRVDAVIGSVVTLFKDDWWRRVADGVGDLTEQRSQLLAVLTSTLSGEVQIIDGMDTLTAALNIARLVALSKLPACSALRESLDKPPLQLTAKLNNISKQIDAELGMLGQSGEGVLSQELAQAMGTDQVDLNQMKRDRINMVAHLVSRVREILAEDRST